MKIRNGFVSNSSSSSFVIKKNALSSWQVYQIKNYKEEALKIGGDVQPSEWEKEHNFVFCKFGHIDDFWHIRETPTEIKAATIMDNFHFEDFLKAIGVREEDIEWGGWTAGECNEEEIEE